MIEFSIVIPAYNAAEQLEKVIERIPSEVWSQLLCVTVIDDGSRDNTWEIIKSLEKRNHKINGLSHPDNRGYGAAVKTGLNYILKSLPDYVICLHADGQYAPEEIPKFISEASARRLDILQGSRLLGKGALKGGMPLYKYIAGKTLCLIENLVFRLDMTDYHSGYLLYSRRALNIIPFEKFSSRFDFDLEIIASARKNRLNLGEMEIPTRYADEKSYLNPVSYGLRVLWVLVKYCFIPSRYMKKELCHK